MNRPDIETHLPPCREDAEDTRLGDAVRQALFDLDALKAAREEWLENWYRYERSLLILRATGSSPDKKFDHDVEIAE